MKHAGNFCKRMPSLHAFLSLVSVPQLCRAQYHWAFVQSTTRLCCVKTIVCAVRHFNEVDSSFIAPNIERVSLPNQLHALNSTSY